MRQFNGKNRLEQAMILGFIPVLGATTHLAGALAAIAISIPAAGLISIVAGRIPESTLPWLRWSVFCALGFGITFAMIKPLQMLLPVPSQAKLYLYLIAATPIIYAGAAAGSSCKGSMQLIGYYTAALLVFSIIREILGNCSLLGQPLTDNPAPLLGLLSTTTGSLLLFAAVLFTSDLIEEGVLQAKLKGANQL